MLWLDDMTSVAFLFFLGLSGVCGFFLLSVFSGGRVFFILSNIRFCRVSTKGLVSTGRSNSSRPEYLLFVCFFLLRLSSTVPSLLCIDISL